jgi:hypothetical protein
VEVEEAVDDIVLLTLPARIQSAAGYSCVSLLLSASSLRVSSQLAFIENHYIARIISHVCQVYLPLLKQLQVFGRARPDSNVSIKDPHGLIEEQCLRSYKRRQRGEFFQCVVFLQDLPRSLR